MTTSVLDFPGKSDMVATLKSDPEFAINFATKNLDPHWRGAFFEDHVAGRDLTFYVDTWRAEEVDKDGGSEGVIFHGIRTPFEG